MDHKSLPFLLGDTLPSVGVASQAINVDLLGVPFTYPSHALPTGPRFAHVRRSGYPLRVVILKNSSGATMKGSRIATLKIANAAISAMHEIAGYANTVGALHPVIIDEFLGDNGVPSTDYFYGIIDGPVKVKVPNDYNDMGGAWTAGDWLYSAPSGANATDDEAGRAAKATGGATVYQVNATPTPDEVTVDHTAGALLATALIGWTLESKAAEDASENDLVLIKANIRF